MKHLSNGHKDHPNQHTNGHKPCNETRHPFVGLLESQWEPRYDHNQPIEGKQLDNKYQHQKKERNPKEKGCENHSQGSDKES